jgi:colanic acid biosynthesis glycosyl transferase WcaI
MAAPLDEVLILTRHYAPEPTGSAPVMQQVAEWLAAHSIRVRTVTVRPNYPGDAIFEGYAKGERDQAVEAGVEVRRLDTHPAGSGGLLARFGPELRFMIDLWRGRLTGAIAPSLCVVSLCPSILTTLGAAPLVRSGGRHVAIVHDIQSGLGSALGSAALRAIMPILRTVERFALNRTDQIIVLSEEMRDGLIGIGVRRPIAILPPSVDTKAIVPMPRADDAPPTLLYSGNLGRKQGLEQILDLAEELLRRGSPARIVIRGDGAIRATLQADAEQRRLVNLTFKALAPKAELAQALSEADIHLVPQIADGGAFAVPSKVFAIMAAGRPFVATADAGSSLGRLAEESGAFVCAPPQSPVALADAVERLLSNPELRSQLGRRGRDYVTREVDTDVVMQRLARLLAL